MEAEPSPPPPHQGWQSGVCSGPQPLSLSRAAETPAFGERRRGAAPGGLGPRRPCPPLPASPFPHPGTRSPPPSPCFGFLSYSSPASSLPDLAELHSWPPLSLSGHPASATPEKPTETAPRPPHRRDLPSLPRRGAQRPRPALLRLLGISPPSPEGSPGGRGRGRSLSFGSFSHRVPPLGAKNKQAASDLQKP